MIKMAKIKYFPLIFLLLLFFQCQNKESSKSQDKEKDTSIKQNSADTTKTPVKKTVKVKMDTIDDVQNEMILFKAGGFVMGSNQGMPVSAPAHKVSIDAFYMSKYPVTVEEFAEFVNETGYVTQAERFGNSGVFDFTMGRWNLLNGAYWLYPLGKKGERAKDDHPVTQVSWNDAKAYCEWAGVRLPSEKEWEYAAHNGQKGKGKDWKFPWGNQIKVGGKFKANFWQSDKATNPTDADGFIYTSPVGYYGEHPSGLCDMSGNVWEWCEDVFTAYPGSSQQHPAAQNTRVIRGGSFMYDQAGDKSLTVYYRAYNTIETSLFNTGFRVAKDAK